MRLAQRFRQLFKPFARDDSYYSHFARVSRTPLDQVGIYKALKQALGKVRGGILDFGCGVGYVADYLGAVGVDVNAFAIGQARKNFPSREFHVKTLAQLRRWRRFGAVVCVNVIEHLQDPQRREFFRLLPRLLRPGGRVLFVYDSMYHPLQVLNALRLPGKLLFDPTHVYCWTQGGFRRLLKKTFEILEERPGNIQVLALPWGNRFATARLYVCVPRKAAGMDKAL